MADDVAGRLLDPSTQAMTAARIAIRRGTPIDEIRIRPCRCFAEGASPLTRPDCRGACEDAVLYVARAIEEFAGGATREALNIISQLEQRIVFENAEHDLDLMRKTATLFSEAYYTAEAARKALALELRRLHDGQPDGHQRPRPLGLVSAEPLTGD